MAAVRVPSIEWAPFGVAAGRAAGGGAAAWVLLHAALMPPYQPAGPSDPKNAPAMFFVSLLAFAVVIV